MSAKIFIIDIWQSPKNMWFLRKKGRQIRISSFYSLIFLKFYGKILWKNFMESYSTKTRKLNEYLSFSPKTHTHTQTHTHTHTHTHTQNKEKYFLLAFSIFLWQIMKYKFIMNLALILMKYGENLAKHLDWLLLHIIISILSFINS